MPAKKRRKGSAPLNKGANPSRRSPAAANLAKPAFRPRVVRSKRAYSRKAIKADPVAN